MKVIEPTKIEKITNFFVIRINDNNYNILRTKQK